MTRGVLPLIVILVAAACATRPGRPAGPKPEDRTRAAALLIRVRTTADGRQQTRAVPLEEYVVASTLSEMSAPAGNTATMRRAYEVQAVLARTYAVAHRGRHASEGYDLCDTTHCQVVDLERPQRSRWANIARQAVQATRHQVVYYADAPARVLFHADCGGRRAAASDVWGGRPVPYLRDGDDPLPGGRTHQEWRFVADREKLRAALNADTRTAVGDRLDTIDVQSRDRSGRARLVIVNGARAPLVRGEDFRRAVAAFFGPRSLRSSRFSVRRDGSAFIFEGQGFGHGVGLCQTGAVARAEAGEALPGILRFYFPGTRLGARR